MPASKKQDTPTDADAADSVPGGPDDTPAGPGETPDAGDGPADGAGPAGPGDGTADGQADPAAQPSTPGPSAAAPVDAPPVRRAPKAQLSKAVEPNAAMRETPGSHVALVGHDGGELGVDDLFVDEGPHRTWVLSAQRIYQRFRYPGTETVTAQLLYPARARVPRDQAERVKATLRAQQASQLASTGNGELPVRPAARERFPPFPRRIWPGAAVLLGGGTAAPATSFTRGGRRARPAAAPA